MTKTTFYFLILGLLIASACNTHSKHPQHGDELHIGIDMLVFDPAANIYLDPLGGQGLVSDMVYSTLFEMTGSNMLVPDLALSYTTNADKTVWRIHLRENAFFQDGTRLRPDDVCYSFQYNKDHEKSSYHNLLINLDKIEVVGENEVEFTFKRYDAFFSYALELIPITKKGQWDKGEKPTMNGTGAFGVLDYNANQGILTLVPNKHYYKKGPYLNKVLIYFLPTYMEGLAMLTREDLDFLYLADPTYEKLFQDNNTYRVLFQKKPLHYVIDLNVDNPQLSSQASRQSMARLLHEASIINQIGETKTSASQEVTINNDISVSTLPSVLNVITIKEHEFSDFILYQLIQSFYAQGIKLTIHPFVFNDFVKAVHEKKYDLALYPADFLFDDLYVYEYANENQKTLLTVEEKKQVVDDIRYEFLPQKREEAFLETQKLLQRAPTYFSLLERHIPMIIHKRFRGYDPNFDEFFYEIQKIWVPREEQKYK
ncbi:ABC transporter substrate-binding protein [bacterium]|nr:ABC transporter substrate-binding protein [bacterium]